MADIHAPSRSKPRHPPAPPKSVGPEALTQELVAELATNYVHTTGEEVIAGAKTFTDAFTIDQTPNPSGHFAMSVSTAEDTALPAAAEARNVVFEFSNQRTWLQGAGPLAQQREFAVMRPTYAAAAAPNLVITKAATFYIEGAPVQGANMTLTNKYALWVASGITQLDGALVLGSTLTLGGEVAGGGADISNVGILTVQVVRGYADSLYLRPAATGGTVGIQKADGITFAFKSDATGTAVNGANTVARQDALPALTPTVVGDFALPLAPTAAEVTARLNLAEARLNAITLYLSNFGISLP